ncbi:MAG: hypothetical protein ACRD3P_09635 [Terriglobales bacterium]
MSKAQKRLKRLGRDQEIEPQELLKRYAALKRFLEDNWGRIGLKLPRVRKPEDVRAVLTSTRNAQWLPAFRDYPTGCLLLDGSRRVSWRQVRETREQYKHARATEGRLSLESHNAHVAAQNARTAFEAAVAEYQQQENSKLVDRQLEKISKQLRVDDLKREAHELGTALREAQLRRESLAKLLESQEAWFARNEVVGFVRDRKKRYSKTPENFAKAMAGLPFYDWLYSLRKCISIPDIKTVPKTYWFQVFELLQVIVKRTRPANLRKIGLKLKAKLLKEDTDVHLRPYITPQWYYLQLALNDCRGQGLRPRDLPYKIMEKFLDHYEGGSTATAELAKHNQLN